MDRNTGALQDHWVSAIRSRRNDFAEHPLATVVVQRWSCVCRSSLAEPPLARRRRDAHFKPLVSGLEKSGRPPQRDHRTTTQMTAARHPGKAAGQAQESLALAYLATYYPTLSHTFIQREILGLEDCGVQVVRFSTRP